MSIFFNSALPFPSSLPPSLHPVHLLDTRDKGGRCSIFSPRPFPAFPLLSKMNFNPPLYLSSVLFTPTGDKGGRSSTLFCPPSPSSLSLPPARVVFLTLATKGVGVQAHSKDFTSEAEESYDLETQ